MPKAIPSEEFRTIHVRPKDLRRSSRHTAGWVAAVEIHRGGATMQLIESRIGDVAIVQPVGRIDSVGSKPFGDRLAELIRSGSHHVLIDLQHILYISSAGFRSLLIARKLVDERRRQARALRHVVRARAPVRDRRLHRSVHDLRQPRRGGVKSTITCKATVPRTRSCTIVLQGRLRTSGSKGALEHRVASVP